MELSERLKRLVDYEIEELCGERIVFRAEAYLNSVSNIRINGNELHSSVQGTMPRPYKVKLIYRNDDLIPDCSCPAEMSFCKHVAATLLAAKGSNIAKISKPKVSNDDITSYISELGKEELTVLVGEYARRFDEIREELCLKMAKMKNNKIDTKEYLDEIDYAVSGSVDYYQMYGFVNDLEKICKSIEKVAKEFPEEASNSFEHFIRKCTSHYENCDDSDGDYGQFIEKLMELHANALSKFKGDQKKIAKWIIVQWENNEYGLGDDVLTVYSKALRKEGLGILEEYFLPKFQSLSKSITPKSRWNNIYKYSSTKEFLLYIYDLLGDDQSFFKLAESTMLFADDYVIVARKLVRLGRTDEAIEKCEQGLLNKDKDNMVLLDMLVDLYRKKKQDKKELNAMMQLFRIEPDNDMFKKIMRLAKRTGKWDKYKEEMIDVLHAVGYYDLLSEIYMRDKNYLSLIKLAHEKECDRSLRERIARFIVQEHPVESINLYRMVISEAIMEMKNHSYRKAAKVLVNLKKLYLEQDREKKWISYLEQIKAEHKAKRNFMGELKRARLIKD